MKILTRIAAGAAAALALTAVDARAQLLELPAGTGAASLTAHQIRVVQLALRDTECYNGPISGRWTAATRTALQCAQERTSATDQTALARELALWSADDMSTRTMAGDVAPTAEPTPAPTTPPAEPTPAPTPMPTPMPAPRDTMAMPTPRDTMAMPTPRDTMAMPMPRDTMAMPMPRDTMAMPTPRDTMAMPTPRDTMAMPTPMPRDTMAMPMPRDTMAMPMPRDTMAMPMPRDTMAMPMPRDTMAMPMPDTTAMAPDSAAGGMLVAQVDSVIEAAEAGLTSLPPAQAATLLGNIATQLDDAGNPQLASIATDLRSLRTQLTATPFDSAQVGRSLTTVSDKVNDVAAGATGEAQQKLQRLGTLLGNAGRQLAPPEE